MAGTARDASLRSKDTSPLRLSPRSMLLHKRPAKLPPLEVKEVKKHYGRKSPRPTAPPPTPTPWSRFHRDCVHPSTYTPPRCKRVMAVQNGNLSPPIDTLTIRSMTLALPTLTKRAGLRQGDMTDSEDSSVSYDLVTTAPTARNNNNQPQAKHSISTQCNFPPRRRLLPPTPLLFMAKARSPGETAPPSTSPSPPQRSIIPPVFFMAKTQFPPQRSELAPSRVYYINRISDGQLSAFLLQVAQAVFEGMVSLESLIQRILEVVQSLVNADRASLFLVDSSNNELVSTVFDLKYDVEQDKDLLKKEIRMPLNKGIAGFVASQGVTLNIPDAYADVRFNKAVDNATGYRTTTILCMPIKVQGQVIAVVQMVNKRDGKNFNEEDESSFHIFSTLFGLALHHARLYDQMIKNEQKYKIALEVLSYHNKCDESEVEILIEERDLIEKETIIFNYFLLNPFELTGMEKCRGFLRMFEDLFDISQFDTTVLARFVLTVKKNYRKVPYHNFDHGWTVANAVYTILKADTMDRFDYNSKLALFVACLCHDLDHRGYTNRFMSDIDSPLACMYSTSTLEHHHFNITVIILQQEGHNIFEGLSSEDYKDVLDMIRQCILATDLAVFFPNLEKINELLFVSRKFSWENECHRALSRRMIMTAADLSAAAKPFPIQLETAAIIQEEFFHQGDLEKKAGREPIAMMDRDKPDEQPDHQIKFLAEICLPCYKVLYNLIPETKVMYDHTVDNIECWKSRRKNTGVN